MADKITNSSLIKTTQIQQKQTDNSMIALRPETQADIVINTSTNISGATVDEAFDNALPIVGTIIGGAIGGLVGYFGGGAAGEAIGEAVTGSYEDSKEKKELERGESRGNGGSLGQVVNDETKQNALLAIQEDVRKIRYGVGSPKTTLLSDASTYSQVQFNTNQSISQKPNYSNRTYIRENTNSSSSIINTPSVDRIALDVSGTLKIQGVGGKSQDLDINKLFDTPEFRNQLCELINNKFGRGGTVTNTRDKNSVQGIIGSYNTPTSNYSLS